MSSILFVLVLALAFYTFFGILFADVFSLAPIFLAIAILCLFFALKKIWTDQHASYDLIKKELDELKAKLPPDDTDEADEATEAKEPNETNE